jgi:hypothetical protein
MNFPLNGFNSPKNKVISCYLVYSDKFLPFLIHIKVF